MTQCASGMIISWARCIYFTMHLRVGIDDAVYFRDLWLTVIDTGWESVMRRTQLAYSFTRKTMLS
jgi:hypothetical protein